MEKVQKIRELEKLAKEDVKNANTLITIRQNITDKKESTEVRIAAIHALRRIVMHYVENGWYHKSNSNADASTSKKIAEYNQWFQSQFSAFKESLISLVGSDKEAYHAVSIRTYIELMKLDTFVETGPDSIPQFNIESFKTLLMALIINKKEIDVDLLLMMRDEIFTLHDCTFTAFMILRELITEVKEMQNAAQQRIALLGNSSSSATTEDPIVSNFETIRKNFIDILRILEVPDEIDTEDVLIPLQKLKKIKNGDNSDEEDSAEDSEEERDNITKEQQKAALLSKMNPLVAELAGLTNNNKRNRNGKVGGSNKKARSALTMYEKLQDIDQYRRVFSKAWLALLSLPFTLAQHKVLLKHLPEHVIPALKNPILLADYLTQSYQCGGIVAVLALESLFHLIMHQNLDYPDFFLSLYNLCTVEVFSAKYRAKFMTLLSMSLKSVNLPAYLVAAFIKRLAFLALHTPSHNTAYCIAQITWLLRQHPQSQVLIHRKPITSSSNTTNMQFNNNEKKDLEKTNALQSSLWEIEGLQQHHLIAAAALAESLKTPESTMITAAAGSAYVHVEDYLNITYADLMDKAVTVRTKEGTTTTGKKEAALAYIKPTTLFEPNTLINNTFGLK